ncbi:hypothetical protein ABVT39_005477 [Epinephelus coioides]
MASSWRFPYPKQQNPGLAYQERPAMPERPDHPDPSPRLTNRPPFPYVPQGGAPIDAHWYQYAPMTTPGTYMSPLMQPPLTNIPNWTPIKPFNPADNSQRALPEDQPPFEIPGQAMTTTEWGMTTKGGMADQTIFNQPPSVINVYDVWPEAVERPLHKLQNETPTTERYKQLVDDLHTQLYDVPAKFYCRLVCSFPLELQYSLCKLRHYTY